MRALRKGSEGFTLIEVLVAFAILATSLGVIAQIFSSGFRGDRVTDAYMTATMLAESKLAALGSTEPLVPDETLGEFDEQFRWQVAIRPYGADAGSAVSLALLRTYEVVVTVAWDGSDGERSVSLATLRLASNL